MCGLGRGIGSMDGVLGRGFGWRFEIDSATEQPQLHRVFGIGLRAGPEAPV
jgi:hypothetical protein